MLNKDQILALKKANPVTTVHTSEGDFGIRIMTGTEREQYEQQVFKDGKLSHEHLRAKLLAKVICDDNGQRLFDDSEIASVSELPAPVILQLFEKAQKINALTKDDLDEMTKK